MQTLPLGKIETFKLYKMKSGVILTNPSLIEDTIASDSRLRFVANAECWFDEDVDFELITPIIS